MSNLKKNINHLHFLLTENFTRVDLKESSDKSLGNYFLITVMENYTCKIVIKKENMESQDINWSYYSNPNDINSTLVERESLIENLTLDIRDIFDKKRFDSDYLSSIK